MKSNEDITKNKKYLDLINTAHDLFWKHGFKRVSIEEICHAAGASKMTYYKFFRNKIELAKTVFNKVMDEGVLSFKNIMSSESSQEEKIKKILLMKFEGTSNLSQEFLHDFYDHSDSTLSKFVDNKIQQVYEEARHEFRLAQQNGLFRKEINMDFYFNLTSKIDYSDPSLTKFFNTPQEMVMAIIDLFVYGIVPR